MINSPLSHLSTQQIDIASSRLHWLQLWERSGVRQASAFLASLEKDGKPSDKSLYRWRSAYASGGLSALAPKWGTTSAGDGARNTLSEQVTLQLQAAWLRQSKPSMRDAVRPRLTELCKMGLVYVAGKRPSPAGDVGEDFADYGVCGVFVCAEYSKG